MTKVVKDGITMVARDKNQLAAFLNNGWKKVLDAKQEQKESKAGQKSMQKPE